MCVPAKLLQLCPTLCDPMDYIAGQAPPSVGFFRQEYWTGLPFPTPGDLPNPGILQINLQIQCNIQKTSFILEKFQTNSKILIKSQWS